jgi:hypothetical protein
VRGVTDRIVPSWLQPDIISFHLQCITRIGQATEATRLEAKLVTFEYQAGASLRSKALEHEAYASGFADGEASRGCLCPCLPPDPCRIARAKAEVAVALANDERLFVLERCWKPSDGIGK